MIHTEHSQSPFPVSTQAVDPALDVPLGVLLRRLAFKRALRKLGRFFAQPPFYILQHAIPPLTMGRARIERLYCMVLDGSKPAATRASDQNIVFRLMRPEDIAKVASPENVISTETCHERFGVGDACAIAEDDGEIVAYNWFATGQEFRMEESGFIITIPECAAYSYDVFVRPTHRGQGLWPKLHNYLLYDVLRPANRRLIISLVDYGNYRSMAAHRQLGYRHFYTLLALIVCGHKLQAGRFAPPGESSAVSEIVAAWRNRKQ